MELRDNLWTTPSIHDELVEFWAGWPDLRARCRERGIIKTLPDYIKGAVGTVFMVIIVVIWKLYDIYTYLWPRITPWGPYFEDLRIRRRRNKTFKGVLLQPKSKITARHPLSRPASPLTHSVPKDLFFGRLPPEIRHAIQVLAFGDQTVHMELEYQYPYNLVAEKEPETRAFHARIDLTGTGRYAHMDTQGEVKWRWFSCVCHRYPPEGIHLPLGRRGNMPWGHFREPDVDHCLRGMCSCKNWPGKWPVKCQIGIMGWLLSCRNAYLEGTNILYRTNTIHIASPTLLRGLQDFIPKERLSELASLELVWKPKKLPLELGFTGNSQGAAQSLSLKRFPLFSSLLFLRISFQRLTFGEIDHATGLVWPYEDTSELSDRLHNHLLPTIDRLLDRIVPASTDVTISCSKWAWYEQIDLKLVEQQGKEKTKPQKADLEGLKCWREIPRKPQDKDVTTTITATANMPGGETSDTSDKRQGYWIHIPVEDMKLDPNQYYDWDRHNLYGLDIDGLEYPSRVHDNIVEFTTAVNLKYSKFREISTLSLM
ncbi:hypothetical protein G7046_g5729 [Stylonectria norvegica]|nr:hypothetical protein G7046_g5729 [Stylonectria norvegica]